MMTDNTNDSAELEEGECSDQDDDGMSASEAASVTEFQPIGFRQGSIPQIVINSDQSDQDDSGDDDGDGDYLNHGKRSCTFSQANRTGSPNFVNPLRSPEIAQGAFKKRRNNVWGAVMTEQILSHDIKQFGVNGPIIGADRDIESYDFTLSKQDDRPDCEVKEDTNENEEIFGSVVDLEMEVRKQQNRKRKRNVKDRLGTRAVDDSRKLDPLNITDSADSAAVTRAIIDALHEQNFALFTRIVDAIGKEKAILLYNRTIDVENSGGMMTNNGYRRRTPGGVYIQLMKSEPSIPEDIVSGVFEEENQKWLERRNEIRQIKKAVRKKWKKTNKRSDMDFDRPETPTPTRELEDLDTGNDAELDVDVSDLPDRPDTPEPNDSSDNVQSEQDEEEEDIAVVIEKAKAAILKKQREIADHQCDENGNRDVDESIEMS